MQPLYSIVCLIIRILNQKSALERDMQYIDELFGSRLKEYSQMPPDHLWLLIENTLNLEDEQKSERNTLEKIIDKI
jgi:hypothetical protein